MHNTPSGVFDVRAKLIAGLIIILAIVLSGPMGMIEFAAVLGCLALILVILEAPVLKSFWLALIVLPFAGMVALFSPLALLGSWTKEGIALAYQTGWPLILDIISKAYLSALVVTALVESTSITMIFIGMGSLRTPRIFLTLFTFLYRFTDLFREQILTMRNAIASRAPHLRGLALAKLYGRLGGNLFVRAYERGEEIHNAMLSRLYDGTLPTSQTLVWRISDTAAIGLSVIIAATIVLYH